MIEIIRPLLASALLIPPVVAEPAWMAELTSPAAGTFAIPPSSTLVYQVSWKGMIEAGSCRIEFAPPAVKKPGNYVILANSASVGAASLLFAYHSNFWSEIDPVTLRPNYFQAVESDDKETESTTVRHFLTKVESSKTTKKLKKDATLWLSDDADRIPIELRAAAFIGDVRATLASHVKP